ncbi:hypothetical protein BT69DRAFT_1348431 [Atractiella rhizophila]|nr:hypothetical protein BT69DRAFT_1348431 [Atractiella rhizophila]
MVGDVVADASGLFKHRRTYGILVFTRDAIVLNKSVAISILPSFNGAPLQTICLNTLPASAIRVSTVSLCSLYTLDEILHPGVTTFHACMDANKCFLAPSRDEVDPSRSDYETHVVKLEAGVSFYPIPPFASPPNGVDVLVQFFAFPERCFIERLPAELLEMIFEHLNWKQSREPHRVCRRWRLIAHQFKIPPSSLTRRLELLGTNARAGRFWDLTIVDPCSVDDATLLLKSSPRSKSLEIRKFWKETDVVVVLQSVLSLSALDKLYLSRDTCGIARAKMKEDSLSWTTAEVDRILRDGCSSPNLQSLRLEGVVAGHPTLIRDAPYDLGSLCNLDIEKCQLRSSLLSSNIFGGKLPRLRSLLIEDSQPLDPYLEQLLCDKSFLSQLEDFDFCFSPVDKSTSTFEHSKLLRPIPFQECRNIAFLSVKGWDEGSNVVPFNFFHLVSRNLLPFLRNLNIIFCHIGCDGFDRFLDWFMEESEEDGYRNYRSFEIALFFGDWDEIAKFEKRIAETHRRGFEITDASVDDD